MKFNNVKLKPKNIMWGYEVRKKISLNFLESFSYRLLFIFQNSPNK
jgi:hypothetical protein